MRPIIKKTTRISDSENLVVITTGKGQLNTDLYSIAELEYIERQSKKYQKEFISINRLGQMTFVIFLKNGQDKNQQVEKFRRYGDQVAACMNDNKQSRITIYHVDDQPALLSALAEGMALGNYQFLSYQKDMAEKENSLKEICIRSKNLDQPEIDNLNIVIDAVYKCRDLINEPLCYLDAVRLSEKLEEMGREAGIFVEVLNKMKIESLKMGGLLAVNRGSLEPPTFTIMEWKPEDHVNIHPVVLVGKGVVFDTGGVNLKNFDGMLAMKGDMAGAAAVSCAIYAIAMARLPVHVIALIPATENRPDGNAYVPGDIITMYDGTHVEVLNTDAEGRMILADALAYAGKFSPELVIDLATLTGAAASAIGRIGIVGMQNLGESRFDHLMVAGLHVHERVVEFPMWDEYGEMIRSDIADIKNIGGKEAGAITAGKFLQHFTTYPWIHLDIAGPALIDKKDGYRSQGGTGIGVRLLFDFIRNW